MLIGAFAACSPGGSGSEETTLDETTRSDEGESEDTSSDESEIKELDGIYGNSILYADNIKNGVQSYYKDGDVRNDYCVENMGMKAEFALNAGSDQKLSYLKNLQGGTYLENTMDVYIRMKDGKTYYASDSSNDARTNVYRIGYYYYDVRILEQSFMTDYNVSKELDFDETLFSHNNSS